MPARKIVLHFPSQLVDKPLIYRLSKDFNLVFNILKASVMPDEAGLMVLELEGEKEEIEKALRYLEKEGVKIQNLSQDVSRDDQKCVSCGVCVPICPVFAFEVKPGTMEVAFNKEKCIACELCINICPYKAMEVKF